ALAIGVVDQAPGREVDGHTCALRASELDGADGSRGAGFREQRVAGEMEAVAGEPLPIELIRLELDRRAAVGRHRPLAGRGDRDDDASTSADGSGELDAVRCELGRGEATGGVG